MASFIIHHIAGNRFLEVVSNRYSVNWSEEEKNQFLLGNLIVDSVKSKLQIPDNVTEEEEKELKANFRKIVQREKNDTHFRDEKDSVLTIQSPKLSKFLEKYYELIKTDMSALGYFFHLYTDKMFFVDLFCDTFECLDKNNEVTVYMKETELFRVKKNGKAYDTKSFFEDLYGDYTVMNKLLLDYYSFSFDEERLLGSVSNFSNPGIEEVDYQNIVDILHQTATFVRDSYESTNSSLNVFDEAVVKEFIERVVDQFLMDYGNFVGQSVQKVRVYKRDV